jgi:hypothetical protein
LAEEFEGVMVGSQEFFVREVEDGEENWPL